MDAAAALLLSSACLQSVRDAAAAKPCCVAPGARGEAEAVQRVRPVRSRRARAAAAAKAPGWVCLHLSARAGATTRYLGTTSVQVQAERAGGCDAARGTDC